MNMDGIPVITDFVGGVQITVPDNSLEDTYPELKRVLLLILQVKTQKSLYDIETLTRTQSALVRQERTENLSPGINSESAGEGRRGCRICGRPL